jgi:hypothetical protein
MKDKNNFRFHQFGSCAICKHCEYQPKKSEVNSNFFCAKLEIQLPKGYWNNVCDLFDYEKLHPYCKNF